MKTHYFIILAILILSPQLQARGNLLSGEKREIVHPGVYADNNVAFRLMAPNADSVHVTGEFLTSKDRAQDYRDYPLKDYYTPDIKRRSLEFDLIGQLKAEKEDKHLFEINQFSNFRFHINTRKTISNLYINGSFFEKDAKQMSDYLYREIISRHLTQLISPHSTTCGFTEIYLKENQEKSLLFIHNIKIILITA